MEGPDDRKLSAEAVRAFSEGIGLVLSRWSALQLAVDNEWGGGDSRRKLELLCSDIFSWFTQSKELLYIDDLEGMLDEGLLSLNTMAEDGSVEEVAEKLMILHEECLDGDFGSIEKMRQANCQTVSRSHVRQVVNHNDEDDDEEEEDNEQIGDSRRNDHSSDMKVDVPESQSNLNRTDTTVNEHKAKVAPEAENGWEIVPPRRSRGKRN